MDPLDWKLLGKGAANAVYRYTGTDQDLQDQVLRLRLLDSGEYTSKDIYDYLQQPEFDELKKYVVPMQLKHLDDDFVKTVEQNSGVQLNHSEHDGILMPNLFKQEATSKKVKLNKHLIFHYNEDHSYLLFEFKPKWLYEPPANFKNCRNCALLMSKGEKYINCNLQILDKDKLVDWCKSIQDQIDKKGYGLKVYDKLLKTLQDNYPVFHLLYRLQNNGDEFHEKLLNLKSVGDVDEFLQFSMTLKDASVIIDLNKHQLNLIDLDKKTNKKFDKWSIDEKALHKYYFAEQKN